MKEKVQDNLNSNDNKFSNLKKPENTNYNKVEKQSDAQISEICISNFDNEKLTLEEALNEIDYWTFYA